MSYARSRGVLCGLVVFTFLTVPLVAARLTNVISAVAPPSISFAATPDDIATGEWSTLVWDTTNATSVTIDNGVGAEPVSGSVSVRPALTTTYTLTATGPGGTSTSQATVTVTDRPVIAFAAHPTHIVAGSSAMLIWAVSNSFTVSIDNGVGPVPENGSIAVFPTTTTTYTMTATGRAGNSSTAQVTIDVLEAPKILSFTATPSTIAPGGSATIAWSVSGVVFATIDPIGGVLAKGSFVVSPTKTTVYRITAENVLGSASATATVTVTVPTEPKHRAVKH
jgi:hypothetical protein